MTMPKTAAAVKELDFARAETLDDATLERLCGYLDDDLPGTIGFIERAARQSQAAGAFTYLSQSPDDMGSRDAWDRLVGYLARLFASPFSAIVREHAKRQYGVDVAFVNCCIIVAQPESIDSDELWRLQSSMQLTPSC